MCKRNQLSKGQRITLAVGNLSWLLAMLGKELGHFDFLEGMLTGLCLVCFLKVAFWEKLKYPKCLLNNIH